MLGNATLFFLPKTERVVGKAEGGETGVLRKKFNNLSKHWKKNKYGSER
jgi:hypothetical protein